MRRSPGFGYIYIPDFTGEERLVRISDLDISDIENQARYGQAEKECYLRQTMASVSQAGHLA